MAEKQDIAMNAFTSATDAEYIYAEATNGSQVKIKKSDFIDIVKRYITSVRFAGGIPDSDLNNIYKNCRFYFSRIMRSRSYRNATFYTVLL